MEYMASIPLKHVAKEESLPERFERLAASWEEAVAHHSSESSRTRHPAYQEIIALGPPVIPLLLRDMERRQGHWFAALVALSGVNPVAASDAGKVAKMIQVWLQWGRENGYQW